MGTEQLFPIGLVGKRRDKKEDAWDEIRVVGGGDSLIVTSNTEFTGSEPISVQQAREDYEWEEHDSADAVARGIVTLDPGPTPEEVFARQTRADREAGVEPVGRRGRKRSDDPAPTRQGGE